MSVADQEAEAVPRNNDAPLKLLQLVMKKDGGTNYACKAYTTLIKRASAPFKLY